MFDVSRSAREAKRFALLDRIYHRGQDLAWSGRDVLGELFDKHSGSKVAAKHRKPLERVLGVIMWGAGAGGGVAAPRAAPHPPSPRGGGGLPAPPPPPTSWCRSKAAWLR